MQRRGSRRRHAAARARGQRRAAARRRAGILRPVRPDDALAAIVGPRAQSRPELVRRVWKYIKAHGLQDLEDGRIIYPDPALRRVLGDRRKVSMFDVPRGLSAHVRV